MQEYSLPEELWAALRSGAADAGYLDTAPANVLRASEIGHRFVHTAAGWSNGIAFGCHPEYGDIVAALNAGLLALKASPEYARLCARYPDVPCDASNATFANVKTADHPEIADHPDARADIVIGTAADHAPHGHLDGGVLGGFDVALTKAVCARSGRRCALVTVPWSAVWPAHYRRYGWPHNPRLYPGEGHQRRWFHCAVGTHNTVARQQSVAFTDPYTDKSAARAAFVVPDAAAAAFPATAAGRTVALVEGWGSTTHFQRQRDLSRVTPADVVQYRGEADLWEALVTGAVEAAYVPEETGRLWLSRVQGYQMVHVAAGWTEGMSYGCHPEYGDLVAALNEGLAAFKSTPEYARLCARYPGVACDVARATFANVKTDARPEIADHPSRRANVVIATAADGAPYSYVQKVQLQGLDVELTKAMCAEAGLSCAVVTVPWQSVWPAAHARFALPHNAQRYPGEGLLGRWFHCAAGTHALVPALPSTALTAPYSNGTSATAGFVVSAAAAPTFPGDGSGRRVALLGGWGPSVHFRAAQGSRFRPSAVVEYAVPADMWAALDGGAVDAVYIDAARADGWMAGVPGYRFVHATGGWSRGLAYGCHVRYSPVAAALDRGLEAVKATVGYRRLCERHPSAACIGVRWTGVDSQAWGRGWGSGFFELKYYFCNYNLILYV